MKQSTGVRGVTTSTMIVLALMALQSLASSTYEPYTFTTIAGKAHNSGSADGTNGAARFYAPNGVAVDSAGNLYVADCYNHTIRKVTPVGTNWVVTTIAGKAGNPGSADGTNSTARFDFIFGNYLTTGGYLAVDSAGNIFVADGGNGTIRKMTPVGTNWVVTTLAGKAGNIGSADGTGNAARFNLPLGVAVDNAGNLYVADCKNQTIRKVTPVGTNWVVTTLAGKAGNIGSADGTKSTARFFDPNGVAVDSAGNLYVADYINFTIRKVTPVGTNWVVTTIAGKAGLAGNVGYAGSADGTNSAARFCAPGFVAADSSGNIFVSDIGNDTIRKVTPVGTNWVVTTLAGLGGSDASYNPLHPGSADGTGSAARFSTPLGVAVDNAGNLYVADCDNQTIRRGYPALAITSSAPSFGFTGGLFGFPLSGPPGRWVVVEASSDLSHWLPVWTNTLTTPAALTFRDPQSGLYSHRFYRAYAP